MAVTGLGGLLKYQPVEYYKTELCPHMPATHLVLKSRFMLH